MEVKLADSKSALELLKQKMKVKQGAILANSTELDIEIINMKYQLWKPKITCGSCSELLIGNDVEVFLPCGHMLCQNCVDQITKSR